MSLICLGDELGSASRMRHCLFLVMARLWSGDGGAGVQYLAGGRDFHFFKAFGLAVGPIKFRM